MHAHLSALCGAFLLSGAYAVTPQQWAALNKSVGGQLYSVKPMALPCYSKYEGASSPPDAAACANVQEKYLDYNFRTNNYNGFDNNQGEICLTNQTAQCLLDNSDPTNETAFAGKSCNQGSLPNYYINIQKASDVVAAYNFAKKTGIDLSIKASGHDYLTRSAKRGSLGLWVRNIGGMTHNAAFIPTGCKAGSVAPKDVMTFGAGINFDQLYKFADQVNRTVIGGYYPTVNAGGGWGQGGGHSVLSPVYGLGIDRTVQFTVVTGDGKTRIANECQNTDLYWALRGGGGGVWGVVLETTTLVEPKLELQIASISFPSMAKPLVQAWLDVMINNSYAWGQQGWGGHLLTDNLVSVNPLLNLSEARRTMQPAIDFVNAHNGTVVIETQPSWYSFYKKYALADTTSSIGSGRLVATRLIPTTLFETSKGRKQISDFLAYAMNQGLAPYTPTGVPLLYSYKNESAALGTSSTPAWRTSLWHLSFAIEFQWNSTQAYKQQCVSLGRDILAHLKALAPNSGAYMNEAFPWDDDWQQDWWGADNYKKLLSIKQKYDPYNLLNCFKCVGFNDSTADTEYPCMAKGSTYPA